MLIRLKILRALISEAVNKKNPGQWKFVSLLPKHFDDDQYDDLPKKVDYYGIDQYAERWDDEHNIPLSDKVRLADTFVSLSGEKLAEIGKDLGLTPSGAKRLISMALEKAQVVQQMLQTPEGVADFEDVINHAFDDYIDLLVSSKTLTSEEETLLRTNYDLVIDLDGFREFLDEYIKDEMRLERGVTALGPPAAKRPGLRSANVKLRM